MAKPVKAKIKLQCPAGAATPAPPVGPALGQHGVNIGEFVKRFNDATRSQTGMVIPVIITVYDDRSFEMEYKSPPASVLLRKAAGRREGRRQSEEGQGRQGDARADQGDRGRSRRRSSPAPPRPLR